MSMNRLPSTILHGAFRRSSQSRRGIGNMSAPLTAEYKQLGKSGLRVSVPILGAMSFGDKKWQEWVIEEDKVCSPVGPLPIVRY